MNPRTSDPRDVLDNFRSSLRETALWVGSKALRENMETAFRSPDLKPAQPFAEWPAQTESLILRRRKILSSPVGSISGEPDSNSGGLLLFDPGQSLSDGAAQVESNGFFDADNIPPWDLWVAFIEEAKQRPQVWTRFDSFLLCWIPPLLHDLVDRSIAANPERCLQWARDVDSPFLRQLRLANLLF